MSVHTERFFIIFAIIAAAFLGYWAIFGISVTSSEKDNLSPQNSSGSFSEKTIPDIGKQPTALGAGESKVKENITEQVARDLSNEFISQGGDFASNPSAMEDVIKSIQDQGKISGISSYLTPEAIGIRQTAIVTVKETDDSPAAVEKYKERYLTLLEPVSKGDFSVSVTGALSRLFERNDSAPVDKIINTYQNIRDGLAGLETPSRFVDFHKKNLTFFENMLVIFHALRDFENDPLRAYAALEIFPSLTQQWTDIVSTAKTIFTS